MLKSNPAVTQIAGDNISNSTVNVNGCDASLKERIRSLENLAEEYKNLAEGYKNLAEENKRVSEEKERIIQFLSKKLEAKNERLGFQ